jgi:hypothetical protein
LILQLLSSFLFPEEDPIEEVDRCTHRTEPATEKIAKDHYKKEHPKGREHSQDEPLLREDGNDPDEGIEPEIEIYRNLQFKGEGGLEDQIEKEEK